MTTSSHTKTTLRSASRSKPFKWIEYPGLSSADYDAFRDRVQQFIDREIQPHVETWENQGRFPRELLRRFGNEGLIGLSLSRDIGGQGRSFWYEVLLTEELTAALLTGWSLSFLAHSNMATVLLGELSDPDVQQRVLRPALAGELYLCLAATEPNSGSDLLSAETAVLRRGSRRVISGEKRYITNGSVARYAVVFVRDEASHQSPAWSHSLYLLDLTHPSVHATPIALSGLGTGDTAALTIADYPLDRAVRVGAMGRGAYALIRTLERERLLGAVAMNQLAQLVLERTVVELQSRHRFGQPLTAQQTVRHRLVDLIARVEASRQFTYRVCHAYTVEPVSKEIAMLKVFAYETCQAVIRDCSSLHGAVAFEQTHWLNRLLRDSQAFTLAAGTSNIMRNLAAGLLQL
ncbi:acyl-CoA/acyl-ACP dehydrogenase [Candidatus Berkelbacteria bacterium]|nr:acyl-CoA/acyl-ACP dehydrogenase [Candidatus Berkelbacteria bacterium]